MDRNVRFSLILTGFTGSLSARRAWIEIMSDKLYLVSAHVALRKESVDRNKKNRPSVCSSAVALRKESVDRNVFLTLTVRNVPSRSPQGERG